MAKLLILKATTDVTVYVKILDSSSSVGAGLTGLVYNSASLTCYYVRPLGSATQITLATQTVTGAHSDGGFVEVSSSNMPGIYRLDLPDAVCATGVNSVVVQLKGATNMVPVELEIQLSSFDPNNATTLGLTNLDATVSSRASQASVDTIDDFLDTEVAAIKAKTDNLPSDPADASDIASSFTTVNSKLDTIDDFLDTEIAAILADTNELQTDWADGGRLDLILDARASQSSVNTIDDFLDTEIAAIITTLGSPAGASISADIAAIEAQTDDIGAAGAGLSAIPWNSAWDAEVESEATDALNAYDPPTRAELTSDTNNILSSLTTVAGYIDTEITTITNRIGAFTGSGVNTILGFFQALMRKDVTTPSDLGGNYDDSTDSLEAIRDRGDSAWTTADVSTLALQASVDDLEGRLTSARAGYLDNLSAGAVALQSSVDDLEGRLTTARAGYLDNLSAGAVATAASIAALNNLSAIQVKTQVVDALNVDTYAEPGQEAPPATTTLVKKIGYLYKAFRNKKTQTATTLSLYADDGTTVDQKATNSDDGTTYTHGELGTGP